MTIDYGQRKMMDDDGVVKSQRLWAQIMKRSCVLLAMADACISDSCRC